MKAGTRFDAQQSVEASSNGSGHPSPPAPNESSVSTEDLLELNQALGTVNESLGDATDYYQHGGKHSINLWLLPYSNFDSR